MRSTCTASTARASSAYASAMSGATHSAMRATRRMPLKIMGAVRTSRPTAVTHLGIL